MFGKQYDVNRALVSLAIERALFSIGMPVYEKTVEKLYGKYRCYVPDCYEHPEYLRDVLKELYGNTHDVIMGLIEKDLIEFKTNHSISRFLTAILQQS